MEQNIEQLVIFGIVAVIAISMTIYNCVDRYYDHVENMKLISKEKQNDNSK